MRCKECGAAELNCQHCYAPVEECQSCTDKDKKITEIERDIEDMKHAEQSLMKMLDEEITKSAELEEELKRKEFHRKKWKSLYKQLEASIAKVVEEMENNEIIDRSKGIKSFPHSSHHHFKTKCRVWNEAINKLKPLIGECDE